MRCSTIRPVIFAILAVFSAVPGAFAQAPRPELTRNIPLDVLCAPQAATALPSPNARVIAGVEDKKALFAPGDLVVIDAGTAQGVQPGQHFFARRVISDRFAVRTTEAATHSIHTAGWLTIVEASTNQATARVSEACDGVIEGDYLEPFSPPVAATARQGTPDFDRPGQILLGDDRRQMGAVNSLMVFDRGSDHGVHAGQRLTIYRRAAGGDGPIVRIGEGIVVSTRNESAIMRIETSREAIQVGDRVAIHR
jgi:hypothetical protein